MEKFDEEEQTPTFPSSLLLNLYLGHFLARWGARSFSIFFILHHLSRFFTGLFYFYLGFFNCLLFISFNEAEFGGNNNLCMKLCDFDKPFCTICWVFFGSNSVTPNSLCNVCKTLHFLIISALLVILKNYFHV